MDRFESIDGDHGRIETRRYFTSNDIDWLQGKEHWAGLKSITMVQRQSDMDNNASIETSYYISSIEKDAKKMLLPFDPIGTSKIICIGSLMSHLMGTSAGYEKIMPLKMLRSCDISS